MTLFNKFMSPKCLWKPMKVPAAGEEAVMATLDLGKSKENPN